MSSEKTREGRSPKTPGRERPDQSSSWEQGDDSQATIREEVVFAVPNGTARQKQNASAFQKI